jgi:hypothetical protein
MIATRSPRSAFAVRAGCVQPLSAVLPAVLRQYGVQWPPAPRASERGVDDDLCLADEYESAVRLVPGAPASCWPAARP